MQRTRTTVKLLVGVAVTALSGCVSVQPQPSAPAPPESSRAPQLLAPQIMRPPVRDTLEALPDPKPSPSASRRAAAPPPAARRDIPRPAQGHEPARAPARPQPRRAAPPVPVPALPKPVTGADVCALGRGYGHWPAGSPQSRICDGTYGH
ncbi:MULTISPECIES: hypothetical protein [unclassified Streptomyces]|uniref:hypothetical protein n=1 Tax=unclassified Streptomyces TaxID=2593676 RepID=UPI0025538C7B|nr:MULTISPECIES: hypothetical protein [unclassified Streptomyces]WRZ63494.1 hypothetical protein OG408_06175 [Streptomyces sp. NBC_01257]WSU57458.1 hypothetical protein OG450_06145 [Streptomyces sp. NBC_01104]